MHLGQLPLKEEAIKSIRAKIDEKVGKFFMARATLRKTEELTKEILFKFKKENRPTTTIEKYLEEIAKLKFEGDDISRQLSELSEAMKTSPPDYSKLIKAPAVFYRLDKFVENVNGIYNTIHRLAVVEDIQIAKRPIFLEILVFVTAFLVLLSIRRK